MITNQDILLALAQHVEPNPTVFCRLAAVNRDFYEVFTSDKVWAPLDVYEIETGIYRHYLKKTRSNHGFAGFCWTKNPYKNKLDFEEIRNRYLELGCYLKHNIEIKTTDRYLLRKMLAIDPETISKFTLGAWQDHIPLVIETCAKNLVLLAEAPPEFLPLGYRLSKRLFEVLEPDYGYFDLEQVDIVSIDERIIEEAVHRDPRLLFSSVSDYVIYNGPEYGSHRLIKETVSDRAKLLLAIRGRAHSLCHISDYNIDREVYLAAYEMPEPFRYGKNPNLAQFEDLEVALAAVRANLHYFSDISPNMKANSGVIKAAFIC